MNAGILLTTKGNADETKRMLLDLLPLSEAGVEILHLDRDGFCWPDNPHGARYTMWEDPCDEEHPGLWALAADGFARLFTTCEVVCWLHDDMLPLPGWWEAMLLFMSERAFTVGIASPCNPEPLEGCEPWEAGGDARPTGECAVDWTPEYNWEPGAVAPLFIRRKCWQECSGLDPELLCFSPWDLMRKAQCWGWDVVTYHGAGVLHAGRQSHLAGLPPLALSRAKNVYKLRHGIALDKDLFDWSEETTCAL